MDAHTIDVDGIPMRWVEHGSGPPVILVHGIPTSPALWRYVMPEVSGARLLAWEMVGYGESIPYGEGRDISVGKQADYLRAWMRRLDIERAVLVGHDLGGGVVTIAAVREPSVCGGLVLTNAIGYDSWPIPSVKTMRAAGPVVARLPDVLLSSGLALLFHRGHDNTRVAEESRSLHLAPYRAHGGGAPLVRQMQALSTRDTLAIQDELGTLSDRPAHVVWGAADPFQKLEYGERYARDLDAKLTTIPRGRHFVPEDHPDALAAAIDAVVREAAPAFEEGLFPQEQPGERPRTEM